MNRAILKGGLATRRGGSVYDPYDNIKKICGCPMGTKCKCNKSILDHSDKDTTIQKIGDTTDDNSYILIPNIIATFLFDADYCCKCGFRVNFIDIKSSSSSIQIKRCPICFQEYSIDLNCNDTDLVKWQSDLNIPNVEKMTELSRDYFEELRKDFKNSTDTIIFNSKKVLDEMMTVITKKYLNMVNIYIDFFGKKSTD